jgi:hypothetical protein
MELTSLPLGDARGTGSEQASTQERSQCLKSRRLELLRGSAEITDAEVARAMAVHCPHYEAAIRTKIEGPAR